MEAAPRTFGRSVSGAAKFCSECGSSLDTDAAFCSNCGKAPGTAMALVGQMPAFASIPAAAWAGTMEVFFAMTTVIIVATSGLSGAVNSVARSFLGQGSGGSLLFLAILSLAQLSIQIALISGLLAQRGWARPMYLWTIGPVVFVTLVIVAQGNAIMGTPGFVAGVLWVAMTALQAALVYRNEKDFTN